MPEKPDSTPIFDDANAASAPPPARVEEAEVVTLKQPAQQCSAIAQTTGERCRHVAIEGGVCLAHSPEIVRQSRGFGGSQPGAGRPKAPKPTQILREAVTDNLLLILKPYFDTLGLEATWNAETEKVELRAVMVEVRVRVYRDERRELIVDDEDDVGDWSYETRMIPAGARLTSSAGGFVNMSHYEDLGAKMKAAGELLDRAFGKAGSTVAITGAEGGALEVRVGQALTDQGARLASELADEIAAAEGDG